MSNYLSNFRRMGFTDADFTNGGSNELVDALVAQGEPDAVAAGLRLHLDAGADHVALQPLCREDEVSDVLAALAEPLQDGMSVQTGRDGTW